MEVVQTVLVERIIMGPIPALSGAEQHSLHEGISLIHQGRFFEAHEVIEATWMECRNGNRRFLQAVIHIAVGCHHQTNGNRPGMLRQFRKAIAKLDEYPEGHGGLKVQAILGQLEYAVSVDRIDDWDPNGIRIERWQGSSDVND